METEDFNYELHGYNKYSPLLKELIQYKDTDIFGEIVLFLNDFNPEWKKKKELGDFGVELILRMIHNFEDRESEFDSSVLWLNALYEDIADQYESTRIDYQFVRGLSEICEKERFFQENEMYHDSEEGLQKAYTKYQLELDDENCLPFL